MTSRRSQNHHKYPKKSKMEKKTTGASIQEKVPNPLVPIQMDFSVVVGTCLVNSTEAWLFNSHVLADQSDNKMHVQYMKIHSEITLAETNIAPDKMISQKEKKSSSNHPFSEENSLLVSGRVHHLHSTSFIWYSPIFGTFFSSTFQGSNFLAKGVEVHPPRNLSPSISEPAAERMWGEPQEFISIKHAAEPARWRTCRFKLRAEGRLVVRFFFQVSRYALVFGTLKPRFCWKYQRWQTWNLIGVFWFLGCFGEKVHQN